MLSCKDEVHGEVSINTQYIVHGWKFSCNGKFLFDCNLTVMIKFYFYMDESLIVTVSLQSITI